MNIANLLHLFLLQKRVMIVHMISLAKHDKPYWATMLSIHSLTKNLLHSLTTGLHTTTQITQMSN